MSTLTHICICGSTDYEVISGIKGHNVCRCRICGIFYSDKKAVVRDSDALNVLISHGSIFDGVLVLPKIRNQDAFTPATVFKTLYSYGFLERMSDPFAFLENVWSGHEDVVVRGESYSVECDAFAQHGFGVSWFIPHQMLWYWGPTSFRRVMAKRGLIGDIERVTDEKFFYSILRAGTSLDRQR